MTNKKNRFFTLVFSCCPGAGEMYMGLYQHGVSLLGAFCAIAAVAFWLNWEELLLILPVIWCYSFFHTHNLRQMTEEEFREVKDDFFFAGYVDARPNWQLTEKYRPCAPVMMISDFADKAHIYIRNGSAKAQDGDTVLIFFIAPFDGKPRPAAVDTCLT